MCMWGISVLRALSRPPSRRSSIAFPFGFGLQAILFLMARCDIVNVYGFNPITTGEPRSYYDPEISESDIMADEAVSFVLTVLSIEGKITWIN